MRRSRRNNAQRKILDIPTTDPGNDLVFSTDDEYLMESSATQANLNFGPGVSYSVYGSMPRLRRNLLQSDLQRRYIEEIGDGFRSIPPQLVISAPVDTINSISYRKGVALESVTHVLPPPPLPTDGLNPSEPTQQLANNYLKSGGGIASPSFKNAKVNNKTTMIK